MSEAIKKVLSNCQQSFSGAEKAQARNNIGALGGVKVQTPTGTSELVPDSEGKVTVDLTHVQEQVQSNWTETDISDPSYIQNKPNLDLLATKAELSSGLAGKQDTLTAGDNISIVGNVISATAAPQQQADWSQTDSSAVDFIKNKPSIPAPQVQSNWTETDNSDPSYIQNKPNLATVATSGSYNDLSDKPDIPSQQVQSDWTEANTASPAYIRNKPASMETKPLVPGTNIEFVRAADSVTINSSGTKVVKRSNPYSLDVPVTEMTVYDPNEDYGALVRDQNDVTLGYLAPKHYGNADEGKVLTVVNDNGYKLEWKASPGGASDLKVLAENTQNIPGASGAYQLTVVDGYAYTLKLNADREIQLVTNSTGTVHTRLAICNHDTSVCGGCILTWRDEALVQHQIRLDLYNKPDTTVYYFDVYIKKVTVNGTTYAIARVSDYPCAYRDGYENGYSTDNINFIGRNY